MTKVRAFLRSPKTRYAVLGAALALLGTKATPEVVDLLKALLGLTTL